MERGVFKQVSVSPWGLVIGDIFYSHHMGSTLVHFPLSEQGLFLPNITGCWTNVFILIEVMSAPSLPALTTSDLEIASFRGSEGSLHRPYYPTNE